MTTDAQDRLATAIEKIEASYEFMLAYAAQGRDREAVGQEGLSIRDFLSDLDEGLAVLDAALEERIAALDLKPAQAEALNVFKQRVAQDAEAALTVVRAVRGVPSISSQLMDNLNASVHLRCLLTDIFVFDEALEIHRRESSP